MEFVEAALCRGGARIQEGVHVCTRTGLPSLLLKNAAREGIFVSLWWLSSEALSLQTFVHALGA